MKYIALKIMKLLILEMKTEKPLVESKLVLRDGNTE